MAELNTTIAEMLRSTQVVVSPETYSFVALTRETWQSLISDPSLSPRMTAPFMILMDPFEVTLLLDEIDLANIRPGLGDAKVERGFRLLSFDSVLEFEVIGFIARISQILADAGVSIMPVSAYSRDHILVKQEKLATALKALGPYVKELC